MLCLLLGSTALAEDIPIDAAHFPDDAFRAYVAESIDTDGNGVLSQEERLKYEVAEELGLLPRLRDVGWAGLSTAESGRIGGIVGARLRQRKRTMFSEAENEVGSRR